MSLILAGSLVAALLIAYAVFILSSGPAIRTLLNTSADALGALWQRRSSAVARRRAATLGWAPYRVPVTAAIWTLLLTASLTALNPAYAGFGILPAALVAWGLANNALTQAFRSWQQQLQRGLPGLVTTLRVHLDLGSTVPDAMQEAIHQAAPTVAQELRLALADMATADQAKTGLARLAERADTQEWRMFADILGQAWGTATSGTALEPLTAQAATAREKAARDITGRLDRVISAAPGLAILAAVIWAGGGYALGALAGHGL